MAGSNEYVGAERRQHQQGFTLIELLVVIVILGILAAVVVFAVQGTGDKGQASAQKIDVRTVRTAQEAYCASRGQYGTEEELASGGFLSEPSTYNNVALSSGGSCGNSSGSRSSYTILCTNPAGPSCGSTQRANLDASGVQATGPAAIPNIDITGGRSIFPAVSGDGRWVAFQSGADNLVSGDTNKLEDVFVKDMSTGGMTRVSVPDPAMPDTEAQGRNPALAPNTGNARSVSGTPRISASGRHVAFFSFAVNLVPGDTNNAGDLFVRDRDADGNGVFDEPGGGKTKTVRSSVKNDGSQASALTAGLTAVATITGVTMGTTTPTLTISYTTTPTTALNLGQGIVISGATDPALNGGFEIIASTTGPAPTSIQIQTATPTSGAAGGTLSRHGQATVQPGQISGDGRHTTLPSRFADLAAGDTDNTDDLVVRDRDADRDGIFDETGPGEQKTVLVSIDSNGIKGNAASGASGNHLSFTGRHIVFQSTASNLVAGDTNALRDIFVHDRDADGDGIFDETGAGERKTVRVSVMSNGAQAGSSGQSCDDPTISGDGRFVAMGCTFSNLVAGDTNAARDVFVHDRDADGDGIFDETGAGERSTVRISVDSNGNQASFSGSFVGSGTPVISADGKVVAFTSDAVNLIAIDANGKSDVFVRDRDLDNDGIFDEPDPGAVATSAVTYADDGTQANDAPAFRPVPSASGRYVVWGSAATNLVAGDTNGFPDIFRRDRAAS